MRRESEDVPLPREVNGDSEPYTLIFDCQI